MNILHQSLGLDNVDSDPNAIPDGRYDGEVFRDVLVYKESDDSLSRVIEYKVESEDQFNGKRVPEWYRLGTEPRIKGENGEPVAPAKGEVKVEDLISFTPGMSEESKPWYKLRLENLGGEEMVNAPIGAAKGIKVTFGVKKNGNFRNVNFVEVRAADSGTTESAGPVSLSDPGF